MWRKIIRCDAQVVVVRFLADCRVDELDMNARALFHLFEDFTFVKSLHDG